MLTSTRKYWLIAIVCGLLAAVALFQYMNQIKSQMQTENTMTVVVAAEQIPANTVVDAKQLKTEDVPVQFVHPNAVTSIDDIVGQAAVTDIARDEIIISDRLVKPGSEQASFSYKLEAGERAITVGIDPVSGVAGYIQTGDHVDVIGLFEVKMPDAAGGEKTVAYSTVVVQNRKVLAVGDKSILSDNAKKDENKTLTLAMTLAEAQKVAWASQFGVIRAVLRSPIDEGIEKRPPVSADDLLAY